jgi:hypothetical protein
VMKRKTWRINKLNNRNGIATGAKAFAAVDEDADAGRKAVHEGEGCC